MYKLRIWVKPGEDYFVNLSSDEEDWGTVTNINDSSELTIEWIQKNLGVIYRIFNPELVEILQVREHSK